MLRKFFKYAQMDVRMLVADASFVSSYPVYKGSTLHMEYI